jgi:D-alanyl-D-alanine carboxypeptidase (penicillin-binding protein 5/6)
MKQLPAVLLLLCFILSPLSGQEGEASSPADDAPDIVSQAAVLMDAATGTVLYAKNSDTPIPPASLTKLMTIHLVMQEVDAGRASLD